MHRCLRFIPHVATAAVVTGLFGYTSMKTVPRGHVGYSNLFGDVSLVQYDPGFHFLNPLANMDVVSLQIRNIKSCQDVASNEGLTIGIEVTALCSINRDSSRDILTRVGMDPEQILIKPIVAAVTREILTKYEAKALYSDSIRREIKQQLETDVRTLLDPYGIVVSDVLINKIELPSMVKTAIEQKLAVEQKMEQMNFKISIEQKEAERKQIEAKGIKIFQDIVSQGIDEKLLKWKGIDATMELAKSTNAKLVIVGGANGLPLILNS